LAWRHGSPAMIAVAPTEEDVFFRERLQKTVPKK
jgi:hypothetical protein